jgi:recombination protein RecR
MSELAPPLERVIHEIAKLPGIGKKTAQRLALHLLQAPREDADALARAIVDLRESVLLCRDCFNLSDQELCSICSDPRRDHSLLCIVEEPGNLIALERTRAYRGLYHVLGGALSPLKDKGPDDLRLRELMDRVRNGGLAEIVLATNPNVEGEATAVYLARLLKPLGVPVTRLAQGLPACSGVALGIDRLLMLTTGTSDIRDVLSFDWERS